MKLLAILALSIMMSSSVSYLNRSPGSTFISNRHVSTLSDPLYVSTACTRSLMVHRRYVVHMSSVSTEKSDRLNRPSSSSSGSSISSSSTNLIKNCVGAGVFSLSNRVATISPNPYVQLPASFMILVMAAWATYNFYVVGKVCEMTKSTTYSEAWSKSVSENSRWMVQIIVIIAPIVSCLASSIVMTDVASFTLRSLGASPLLYANRNLVITLLSVFILFPLCSLKDLTALKNVSKFGLGGQALATLTLLKRYLDKSYFPGGIYSTRNISPAIAAVSSTKAIDPKKWFVLASLLSYCFVTHYNAPKYYNELEDPTPQRFGKMAAISYISAAAIYIITMSLGFVMFGQDSKSFLLNNLAAADPLAIVARLAFGASVLASFPLIFMVMRNWFISQAKKTVPILGDIKSMTALLLGSIGLLTTKFTDIGFVGSVSGATLGVSMAFIFPSIMYLRTLWKESKKTGTKLPVFTVAMNIILLLGGLTLSVFGTFNSLFSFKK